MTARQWNVLNKVTAVLPVVLKDSVSDPDGKVFFRRFESRL